jgi:hypothetical protein
VTYFISSFGLVNVLHSPTPASAWSLMAHAIRRYSLSFLLSLRFSYPPIQRAMRRRLYYLKIIDSNYLCVRKEEKFHELMHCSANYISAVAVFIVYHTWSFSDFLHSHFTVNIVACFICVWCIIFLTITSHSTNDSVKCRGNSNNANGSSLTRTPTSTSHTNIAPHRQPHVTQSLPQSQQQVPYPRGPPICASHVRRRRVPANSVTADNQHQCNIRCGLLNVRSLSNKTIQLADLIVQYDLKLVCVTETWLRNDATDNAILRDSCPTSYNYYSLPRDNRRGGGIALFFHDSLVIKQLCVENNPFNFESAFFLISCGSKTIALALMYRIPSKPLNVSLDELFTICTRLCVYDDFILLGDFNMGSCPNTDTLNVKLVDFLSSFLLQQHVSEPTHDRGNILDLIFTRQSSTIINSVTVHPGLSDHFAVLFQINLPHCSITQSTKSIAFRNFKHFDIEGFSSDISSFVSTPIVALVETQQAQLISDDPFKTYDEATSCLLNIHAPQVFKIVHRQSSFPWYNDECRCKRRQLRRVECQWRLNKSTINRQMYITIKHEYHSVLNMARSQHIVESLLKVSRNSKLVWSALNKNLNRKIPPVLPEHTDSEKLACDFNEFFLSKPLSLQQTLRQASTIPLQNPTPVIPSKSLSNFEVISPQDILAILRRCPRKSCILDTLPAWIFYKCLNSLVPAVHALVNLALRAGMPELYKTSLVIPLLKKANSDCNDFSNYRPVSNLPFVSKIVERAVNLQLLHHLETHSFLDPQQSAYRRHHSCETAVMTVLNAAFSALDNKKVMVLVLLDMSSAFDTVDHKILSIRLQQCGIVGDALSWIIAYLTNRKQVVFINGKKSAAKPVVCGVPQGSVLGPLLFLVYLTGLKDIISPFGVGYMLYADDLQLYAETTVADLGSTISRMEGCITAVKSWLAASLLTLNESKTEWMIIGSPACLKKCSVALLTVGSVAIPPKEVVRDLGVWLDSSLTMKAHVRKVCAKSFGGLRLVHRLKNIIPRKYYTMLIHSLVLSHIEYCLPVLYGVPDSTLSKLQSVVNSALRAVAGLKKYDHISEARKKFGWLTVEQRIKFRMATIVFSVLKFGSPSHLRELLNIHVPTRNLRSGEKQQLQRPLARTEMGKRAFSYCAPSIWNALPCSIKEDQSIGAFCDRLKSYLLCE